MQAATTLPTALHYMATHHDRATALFGGFFAWNVGMAVETATGDGGLGVLAQLGVAAPIVAILLFVLRRYDQREQKQTAAVAEAESALENELRRQIATLTAEVERLREQRPPGARTRKEDR